MEAPGYLSSKYYKSVLGTPSSKPPLLKRKAETTPPGNAQKMPSVAVSSDSSVLRSLQETLDGIVAGQTAMVERFGRVEEQIGAVTALAHSHEFLKEAIEDCQKRVKTLEDKLSSLPTESTTVATQHSEVRKMAREEIRMEAIRNNVVSSGVPDADDGKALEDSVKTILPDIAPELLAARRIGKPFDRNSNARVGSSTASEEPRSPRVV